jgi:virginiamycin B lyase
MERKKMKEDKNRSRRNTFLATTAASRGAVKHLGSGKRFLFVLAALIGSIVIGAGVMVAAHATGVTQAPTQTNPWGVVKDSKGHVWVAEPGCDASPTCPNAFPSVIGKYSSTDTLLKNYTEPAGYSSPVFLALDASGNIWFTEPTTNAIGELIPGSTPTWHQWTVPTANAVPYDLVFDKNGNLWFTEYSANQIGFFNPTTATFVETKLPSAASKPTPYGITLSSNGKIWVAENGLPNIATFLPTTTGSVSIKEISFSSLSSLGIVQGHMITSDSKGNIWFSAAFSGYIVKYSPKTKKFTPVNVSTGLCTSGCHISGIAVDGTGNIWFDDSLTARVGYYNPTAKATKTLTLTNTAAHPHDGLMVDGSGNTWCTEVFGLNLDEIPAGTL